ncbi:recombination regulator RecX [Neobacillus sp. PS3-34]|uniref:recombination regulator RecX n=1 Tax=Neobacillus sp. PS3-34 TaxID=3070678 RepID=UPI0027DFC4FB|nr:recombination regulator RecX [Neobacillus sp. PS3-34]WML49829.1 recombination regulator RecX [Neobacillus sp. PS3-34]
MPIITKITTQQKRQDRYNIFMDYGNGEQYAFSVDENVLLKFRMKKGMELDDLSLMEINYQDDIRKAYNLAISHLASRIRSEKEIRDYLSKKEMEDPVINEVVHKLIQQNYINDLDFALAYVRTQMNTTDKGINIIKTELKEKGITGSMMEDALKEYPFEIQVEKAVKLCDKNSKKNTKESKRMAEQKLESMLMRKGYPFDVIQIAVKENKEVDDEQENDEFNAIRFQGEKLQRKYSKYNGFEYKQKMKQALFRKGFSFDLIERFLDEQEHEE